MNAEEQQYADAIYAAIQAASNESARSMQSKNFQAGVSDLGFCSTRVLRMLRGEKPGDTDVLAAFLGTAVGDHVEQAVKAHLWPEALIQAEIKVTLEGGELAYVLTGHPDIVLPEGVVLDPKTVDGLAYPQRHGAAMHQNFQRHLYAKGAHECGLFYDDVRLEDVKVGNVWIDRAGNDKFVHVELVDYDPDVIADATAWLDEVTYSYINKGDAPKEPPRQVCEVACGFFDVCRLYDTDVEGLITDESQRGAVEMYVDGQELSKEGKRLTSQAKNLLEGVSGSTGQHFVRWTYVNPTVVETFSKRGYWKMDVTALKR